MAFMLSLICSIAAISAGVTSAKTFSQKGWPSMLSKLKIWFNEGTCDAILSIFLNVSPPPVKTIFTDASLKIKTISEGLVVGYTGHKMMPACWHARSSIIHSGLLLAITAILCLSSIAAGFPPSPCFIRPALSLFTMLTTFSVA